MIYLQFILLFLLIPVIYQDFKFRGVVWYLFPLLFICSLGIFFFGESRHIDLVQTFIFLIVVISLLFLYISLKEKKWTNIFKTHLGLGDVLFFVAILPLFNTSSFILFFTLGMFLSGIIHLILNRKKEGTTVPLAGYLALFVFVLQVIEFISSKEIFHFEYTL